MKQTDRNKLLITAALIIIAGCLITIGEALRALVRTGDPISALGTGAIGTGIMFFIGAFCMIVFWFAMVD